MIRKHAGTCAEAAELTANPMGYELAIGFRKGQESDDAHNLVKHTGVSLGSFR
jgi:hypothetical protein